MNNLPKITGSGWKFEPARVDGDVEEFDPNEPLDFSLIDEANEEINKAQKSEGEDWWRK